jgi:hypothetical protein
MEKRVYIPPFKNFLVIDGMAQISIQIHVVGLMLRYYRHQTAKFS